MAEAESSNQNPEKTINFQITPPFQLARSIRALRDPEFNPLGLARVDITERGLEFTAINFFTNVIGYVIFESPTLINFHCSKPIVSKIIDLNHDSLIFLGFPDDDTVTIFHRDGSNLLTFIFGSDAPMKEFEVEFLETTFEISKFAKFSFFCEALLTTSLVRRMIEKLDKPGKSKEVSIDISDITMTIFIRNKLWTVCFPERNNKVVETRGMAPGQNHHAWFAMPHLESLKHAAQLSQSCAISFLNEPANHIILRFNLTEQLLGYFVFMFKADAIIPNSLEFVRLGLEAGLAKRPPV